MKPTESPTPGESRMERAKVLILRDLGVKRVAAWTGVSDATVYQWLSRATERAPVPAARGLQIIHCATREGVAIDADLLVPGLASLKVTS
jgi:predicted DNA-binding transcriptional regulator AlpA